jgi:hypothetical protein
MIDPSRNGTFQVLSVSYSNAATTYVKLIAVEYDPSWGTTWAVKEFGYGYTLI